MNRFGQTSIRQETSYSGRVVRLRRATIAKRLIRWYRRKGRSFPWRLQRRTPYATLLAEILLRRTTSKAVARVFPRLIEKYPNVEALTRANSSVLRDLVSQLGLENQRVRALKAVSSFIVKKKSGSVPDTYDSLRELPYVGSYTAGAVLSFGFGKRFEIVDSNVERIVKRLFVDSLPADATPKDVGTIASQLVPRKSHVEFNWGLLDLGASVCIYPRPRCEGCCLLDVCDTGRKAVGRRKSKSVAWDKSSNA